MIIIISGFSELSKEFYSHLPHKNKTDITDKRAIAEKQDLCQVSYCNTRQLCVSTAGFRW